MRIAAFIVAAGLALVSGCSKSAAPPQTVRSAQAPAKPATGPATTPATQVIAFYFHGTVRCETCLRIEKQAQELINTRFSADIGSERLAFKAVNYDKPENAHFSRDYQLPCPSLVLVRQKGGKDQDWKLLGQTWDFVQVPFKLDQDIEEETSKFLEATGR